MQDWDRLLQGAPRVDQGRRLAGKDSTRDRLTRHRKKKEKTHLTEHPLAVIIQDADSLDRVERRLRQKKKERVARCRDDGLIVRSRVSYTHFCLNPTGSFGAAKKKRSTALWSANPSPKAASTRTAHRCNFFWGVAVRGLIYGAARTGGPQRAVDPVHPS